MLKLENMLSFILNFLSVLLTAKILGISYDGWLSLIIFTLLLVLVNSFFKPIIKFFTWPINLLTLGIFHTVLSVLLIVLISFFTPGFSLTFWQALIFGLVYSLVSWILFKFKI